MFAVLLVYLLMVVNFQSWLDPFIILTALPGRWPALCGCLYLTGTTLSVPALMGAIMCIGVATSNSILLITFANDQRRDGHDARSAALSAGATRLRPVLMTALAMIIGMLPMSLGLGEGGEQNAPLGRAVIGGLLVATFFTLLLRARHVQPAPPQAARDRRDRRRGGGGPGPAPSSQDRSTAEDLMRLSSCRFEKPATDRPTADERPRAAARSGPANVRRWWPAGACRGGLASGL